MKQQGRYLHHANGFAPRTWWQYAPQFGDEQPCDHKCITHKSQYQDLWACLSGPHDNERQDVTEQRSGFHIKPRSEVRGMARAARQPAIQPVHCKGETAPRPPFVQVPQQYCLRKYCLTIRIWIMRKGCDNESCDNERCVEMTRKRRAWSASSSAIALLWQCPGRSITSACVVVKRGYVNRFVPKNPSLTEPRRSFGSA